MENCIRDLRTWMLQDKLKTNDDKIEFITISSKQQFSKLNKCSILVGSKESNESPYQLRSNDGLLLDFPRGKMLTSFGDKLNKSF